MVQIKKWVIVMAIAASLLLAMASMVSAQGGNERSDTPAASPSSEKTTISIWVDRRHDAEFMKDWIDRYNASNKDGVVVEWKILSDNYLQAVDLAIAAGEAPDIIGNGAGVYTKYVNTGAFEPLNKYMSAAFRQRFADQLVEGINQLDGKVYYLAPSGTTTRLFYNKGIFERAGLTRPPRTLDEMVSYSKTISAKLKGDGIYGFAANLKNPGSALGRSLDFIVTRYAGIKIGFDFKKGEYDFSAFKPAIQAFRDIFTSEAGFPGSLSLDIDPLRSLFAQGKIGMYISYSHAEPGVYASQFPTEERWGVAQLPTIDGTAPSSQSVSMFGGMMINSKSRNLNKAWAVYEKLLFDQAQLVAYHEAGLGPSIVPSVLSVAKQPPVIALNPDLVIGGRDKIWPLNPAEYNAQAVVIEGRDWANSFMEAIVGNKDIDAVIRDVTARYNDAYRKGIAAGKGQEIRIPNFDPLNPLKK